MKTEIEKKLSEDEKEIMIIGDFNGHSDELGEQRQAGRMMLDWMDEYGPTAVNMDERYPGKYTWRR